MWLFIEKNHNFYKEIKEENTSGKFQYFPVLHSLTFSQKELETTEIIFWQL